MEPPDPLRDNGLVRRAGHLYADVQVKETIIYKERFAMTDQLEKKIVTPA